MIEAIIFIFGLLFGSFLNVVILRLGEAESIVNSRSHCMKCKKMLAWHDLIPLISFVMLRGKCRYCKEKISWQYPMVEFIMGLFLVLAYWLTQTQGLSLDWQIGQMIFYTLIIGILIVIFFYDLYHMIIPDEIVWPGIIIALVYGLLFSRYAVIDNFWPSFSNILIGGVIGVLFPAIFAIPSRGTWMGYGDIKLGALIGLVLGYPLITAGLLVTVILGGIVGLGLLLFGKKKMKSQVPYGPFLVAGSIAALFWGGEIIKWWANIYNM